MSGTSVDIIPIVIVPVVILAGWLGVMFHANSHPEWAGQARADNGSTRTLAGSVPAQRLGGSGPVVPGQRLVTASGEVTPAAAQASGAQHQ